MVKRERWRLFWTGVVIILFIVGVYGCQDLFSTRGIREREPVTQPIPTSYQFEDIPLPIGMTLNQKESFLYETGATKAGLLVYEGKGEIGRLSAFFKQQMPKHQWRLVSNFELNNVMLTFIKEGWISIIYILPQGDEMKRVEIRVGPIDIKTLPPSKE